MEQHSCFYLRVLKLFGLTCSIWLEYLNQVSQSKFYTKGSYEK